MSKAERRKRAKARARERQAAEGVQQAAPAAEAGGTPATEALGTAERPWPSEVPLKEAIFGGGRVEAAPPAASVTVDAQSQYITEPIAPAASSPVPTERRAAPAPVVPQPGVRVERVLIDEPLVRRELDAQLGDDEQDGDEDEDEGGEPEGEDDDDDDDDDEDDEEDALVELASALIDKGSLPWRDVVPLLCIAEVSDPRLALVCGLLMESEQVVDSETALGLLVQLGMQELVTEARDAVSASADDDLDEDEQDLVRRSALALGKQSKAELASPASAASKKPRPLAPRKASELRAQSSLGTGVLGNAARPK